ncbi:hypothetical protein [Methanohalophilus sp.]|uniref:hypothetical protein n=1 Tax=Methanohalophilus sp. TaxID=1966352 RepID=UPI002602DFE0|nr:hypothetical protein [Methanohalophilus sp.]
MPVLQSTVLSETSIIEGNSVTLPICKVGRKPTMQTAKPITLAQEALESGAET